MKIHYEVDCPPTLGEPVAVIGYGSQGRAHALNLHDSGEDVRVGLYPGSKSIERVEADGLRAVPVPEAVSEATVVDRKSTRLNSSHVRISYAVFCLKKKNKHGLDSSHTQ